MGSKYLSVSTLVTTVLLIAWSTMVNTGFYGDLTIGEVSRTYPNLFTPADYAFSIWGLIYFMLIVFSIYCVVYAFRNSEKNSGPSVNKSFIKAACPWVIRANIFCGLWVYFWVSLDLLLSVVAMVLLLFSLLVAIVRLDMERWDAPFPIIAFVWWPICLYSGWISLALIANAASYLNTVFEISTQTQWIVCAVMIAAAFFINTYMVWERNMREFASVGIWGLAAIAVRHYAETPVLFYCATGAAVLLVVQVGIHGFKNKDTNPGIKFKQWRQRELS